MEQGTTSSPPSARPVTLMRLMGAIAVSAIGFAFLPMPFSAAVAVAVCGTVLLDGMRLPVVGEGGQRGRNLLVLWLVALMSCPIAACVVPVVANRAGRRWSLDWTIRVIEGLAYAHLAVSVIAWILVVVLARGGGRWVARAAILTIGVWAFVMVYFALVWTVAFATDGRGGKWPVGRVVLRAEGPTGYNVMARCDPWDRARAAILADTGRFS
jgi:hypothetical protein